MGAAALPFLHSQKALRALSGLSDLQKTMGQMNKQWEGGELGGLFCLFL